MKNQGLEVLFQNQQQIKLYKIMILYVDASFKIA